MRYLCAVYLKPNALRHLSANELAKLNRGSVEYDKQLVKKGVYLASSALQPPGTAKTVRRRGKKVTVTDGPFAESKEVLSGFLLIEAQDMQEAVSIAKRIPVGRFASIEVRPEMKID